MNLRTQLDLKISWGKGKRKMRQSIPPPPWGIDLDNHRNSPTFYQTLSERSPSRDQPPSSSNKVRGEYFNHALHVDWFVIGILYFCGVSIFTISASVLQFVSLISHHKCSVADFYLAESSGLYWLRLAIDMVDLLYAQSGTFFQRLPNALTLPYVHLRAQVYDSDPPSITSSASRASWLRGLS